jgi:hypothetical protein
MKSYYEILKMVAYSCNDVFYNGHRDVKSEVLKSATKIYIAELQKEQSEEKRKQN